MFTESDHIEVQRVERRIFRLLVAGELTILGVPVKAEWPEGLPLDMTAEQLLIAFPEI